MDAAAHPFPSPVHQGPTQMGPDEGMLGAGRALVSTGGTSHGLEAEVDRYVLLDRGLPQRCEVAR